ncbi:MAG: transcription antitermination factor NusB [Candidatus Gastranaerophilales bacterium]|nr:transcription antitermination factor NusB [Candidatus Gastranaerophilales bacterium]
MQARRASRELALILFSQLDKNLEKYKSEDFADIILKSVRTLISSLYDEVSICASSLSELKNQIIEYENNHKDNLSRPIDATNIPVPMILTSEFEGKIDTLLNAADKAQSALEIAELSALANKEDVREYIMKICFEYKEHKDEIDKMIGEFAFGWDLERIFKIDRDILRIAITELAYIKDAPHKVVIDEALELAKKYSTDDSPSFINGILARVVEKYV